MDLAVGGVNAATGGQQNGEAGDGERGVHHFGPETGHRRRPHPVAGGEHHGAPEPAELAARARATPSVARAAPPRHHAASGPSPDPEASAIMAPPIITAGQRPETAPCQSPIARIGKAIGRQ